MVSLQSLPRMTFGVLLVVGALTSSASSVAACSPAGPDPWFTIAWNIDAASLPGSVTPTDNPENDSDALTNASDEPLYILSRLSAESKKSFTSEGIPEGYEPELKIVSGQVLYWNSGTITSHGVRYVGPGWVPNHGGKDGFEERSWTIAEHDVELDAPLQQTYQDRRPRKVDIPEPQSFHIPVLYQGTLMEIHGTANYSLNEAYDPTVEADSAGACEGLDGFGKAKKYDGYAMPIAALSLLILAAIAIKIHGQGARK